MFKVGDYLNRLILITPTEYVEGIMTTASVEPKDAVRCDVVVLDREDGLPLTAANVRAGDIEEFKNSLIFPGVLVGMLKRRIGKGFVLGRIAQGEKKPGRNAPWVLKDASEEDKVVARMYLNQLSPI
jgi:hypothetical protein